MGTNGADGNFDIHTFFKNPPPVPPQGPAYPPPGHSLHNFAPSNFTPNSYTMSSYSNLAASYPFGPQASLYNHYPPYPQDQVSCGTPYPAPGFDQPALGAVPLPLPLSASFPPVSSPNLSSPALDSARLMALLSNPTTWGPSPNLYEHPSTDLELAYPPAVPSAPPANLAPTSLSGRFSRSKFPGGRHLKGEHVIYDIDIRVAGEAQPQLEHNTITKYISDPQVLVGRQIAVNKTYICYALRASKGIRVLNINTALKYLLRGHSEGRVTDMAFFADNVHLLASASTDGRLFVRKIVEGPGENSKIQISDQTLLAIQFTGNWDSVHPHVCWHAHTEDLIVVSIEKYVFTIDIKKVRQCTAPDGFSVEQPVLCPVDSPIEGVQCAGKHLKEVTGLSTSQWTRLVSASKDGTVRIWREQNMLPPFTLVPHDGSPVDAVALLSAPHLNDHVVLLTAGPLNRELKLWVPSVEEGWFPRSGPLTWNCTQTLELKSSSTEEPNNAFFNQVLVVPKACVILLPNARRKALYVVHVDFGATPSATRMNYLAEFLVMMPIFSITATSENVFDGEGAVQVYCVQTEAIQQYTLDLSLCVPTMESATCNVAEKDLKGSLGGPAPNLEASSTALEVSAMLRAKSPGPISGISLTDNILGGNSPGTINMDYATSPDKRLGISSGTKDTNEMSINNLSSNVPRIIAPTPQIGAVVLSPRSLSRAKSNLKTSTANNSPRNKLEFVCFEQNEENKNEPDLVKDSYPLSPGRPSNEVMRISEDRDWQVISTSPEASTIKDQHVGLGSMHLITPSELMSMVARSKGKVNTGGSVVSSPRRGGGISAELTKPELRLEGFLEKVDVEVLTVETKEVTESSLLFPASASLEKEASLTRGQGSSDVQERDHKTASETMCTDNLRDEKDMVEQLHFDSTSRGTQVLNGDLDEPLPDIPVVEELCEQFKDVSVKVDESLSVQVSHTRKKKNKNKTDINLSGVMPLPASQLPSSSVSAQCMSDQDLAVGLSNVSSPLSAIAAQVFSLQDSVNQLISMQRDFQKQLGTILAGPIAKEVKKMEVSLGQRMEKLLKAHTDAIWARVQEDNGKREKLERDRVQQLTLLVTNYLNKEIPGALDKSLKKEFSSIGSHVTRLVIPSIEKAISTAVNESLQGVAEKGVAQLEKSLTPKVETLVSRLLQTQFQTNAKHVLQEGLRSCLEVSIVPAFERACKEMLGQVDAAFQKGLLEHRAQAQQQLASSQNALIMSLQETISQASSLAGYMKGDLSDCHRKLLTVIESASSACLPKPISGSLPEKAMTVEHVEESLDPTKELSRLISERKLEEAFNRALSLTDVGIVSWLCNQVDPAALFTTSPPPLSQGVLLALVQQLGCDLGNDTSKKLMWIKDAAIALNPHDPVLASHMRHFLEKLYANLHALAKTSLSPELANSTRLVTCVVHSLLSVCK